MPDKYVSVFLSSLTSVPRIRCCHQFRMIQYRVSVTESRTFGGRAYTFWSFSGYVRNMWSGNMIRYTERSRCSFILDLLFVIMSIYCFVSRFCLSLTLTESNRFSVFKQLVSTFDIYCSPSNCVRVYGLLKRMSYNGNYILLFWYQILMILKSFNC